MCMECSLSELNVTVVRILITGKWNVEMSLLHGISNGNWECMWSTLPVLVGCAYHLLWCSNYQYLQMVSCWARWMSLDESIVVQRLVNRGWGYRQLWSPWWLVPSVCYSDGSRGEVSCIVHRIQCIIPPKLCIQVVPIGWCAVIMYVKKLCM